MKLYLKEIGWEGLDRIQLAQDRDRWQGLANGVMKLGFHEMPEIC